MKFRLFMRDVATLKLGWDTPLPSIMQEKWRQMLHELVNTAPIYIPRYVRPPNSVGKPELIVFWDGSLIAYAAPAYLRYEITEECPGPWADAQDRKSTWKAALLASKGKLASLAGISPPRSKMNSYVLAHKLAHTMLLAMKEKPSRITFIGGIECTIAAAECNSATLKAYLANRVNIRI